MPKFGSRSTRILNTCHPDIILVAHRVIPKFDFSVLSGQRGQHEQNQLFNDGFSKTPYPQSKHNKVPSWGIDIAPYPIDWDNIRRFVYLAGHWMQAAYDLAIGMRWGGDWGRSNLVVKPSGKVLRDWGHFEILG